MPTLLLTYLFKLINLQQRLISLLLNQLIKSTANSKAPKPDKPRYHRFNHFAFDEQQPIFDRPEKLDHRSILKESLEKNGKVTKPIKRRSKIDFQDVHCPRCDAPSDYLYANNGKGRQLVCKVCKLRFSPKGYFKKKLVIRCPYCERALDLKDQRKGYRVWRCSNQKCPFRLNELAKLSPDQLKIYQQAPFYFKLRYYFREPEFDFAKLSPDSPIKPPVDLSRIQASPYTLGLIMSCHVNYRMSAAKTAAFMYDVFGLKLSRQTILNYSQAVAARVKPFQDNFPFELSDEFVADETYLRVKGKWHYLFYCYDAVKKIIIADHVSPDRSTEAAIIALHQLLKRFPENTKDLRIAVDANPIYKTAQTFFKQHMGIDFDLTVIEGLTNKNQTAKTYRYLKQTVERLNREFKSYYRQTTGFGSLEGAIAFVTLDTFCHNFLRPHQGLNNRVPVELTELQGIQSMPDKWIKVLSLTEEQLSAA